MISSIKETKRAFSSGRRGEKVVRAQSVWGSGNERQVQRPRGRTKLDTSRGQNGGRRDRKRVSGESLGDGRGEMAAPGDTDRVGHGEELGLGNRLRDSSWEFCDLIYVFTRTS